MSLLRRSMHMVLIAAALLLLLGLLLPGCKDLSGGTTTTTVLGGDVTTTTAVSLVTTTTAGPVTTVSHTPSTVSGSEHVLSDGRIKVMGYISNVWVSGGVRHLKIDYADMWSGAEAQTKFDEAVAAGREPADATLDGDWYITNIYHTTYTYVVSDSVVITTATRWAPHIGMTAPCTWSDFHSFWGGGALAEGDTNLRTNPWWIWREGDTVVKIAEQYLE